MNKGLNVSLIWFCGVNLTFSFTALPILLVLIARVYGIQPETLSGLIGTWFFGSLTVSLLPALMIALDVADDELVDFFTEYGERMFFYGNFIAWAVWLVLIGIALLFALAFHGELFGFPDEPSVPFYRRVWGWTKSLLLAALVMALPNNTDDEIPD